MFVPGLFADVLFMIVPRCFMVWWVIWSKVDPAHFPMPAIISNRFPRYELDIEDTRISSLLLDIDHKQSKLGNLLEEAWNIIEDTDRLLMMVCWAGRQEVSNIRNLLVHPTIPKVNANSIISSDLSPSLHGDTNTTQKKLLDRALTLINTHSLN